MARRRKVKTFTLDELRELRGTLSVHDTALTNQIGRLLKETSFEKACELRNAAQRLVTTRMVMSDGGALSDAMMLAEITGEARSLPFIEDCGIDI